MQCSSTPPSPVSLLSLPPMSALLQAHFQRSRTSQQEPKGFEKVPPPARLAMHPVAVRGCSHLAERFQTGASHVAGQGGRRPMTVPQPPSPSTGSSPTPSLSGRLLRNGPDVDFALSCLADATGTALGYWMGCSYANGVYRGRHMPSHYKPDSTALSHYRQGPVSALRPSELSHSWQRRGPQGGL